MVSHLEIPRDKRRKNSTKPEDSPEFLLKLLLQLTSQTTPFTAFAILFRRHRKQCRLAVNDRSGRLSDYCFRFDNVILRMVLMWERRVMELMETDNASTSPASSSSYWNSMFQEVGKSTFKSSKSNHPDSFRNIWKRKHVNDQYFQNWRQKRRGGKTKSRLMSIFHEVSIRWRKKMSSPDIPPVLYSFEVRSPWCSHTSQVPLWWLMKLKRQIHFGCIDYIERVMNLW